MTNQNDHLIEQEVEQAIKDNDAIAHAAKDVHVIVNNGDITFEGQVPTGTSMSTITNTATAIGVVEEIHNHLEVIHKKAHTKEPSGNEETH